jgi:hypothetical protein
MVVLRDPSVGVGATLVSSVFISVHLWLVVRVVRLRAFEAHSAVSGGGEGA